MMRRGTPAAWALLLASIGAAAAPASAGAVDLNLLWGQKQFDDDFEPLDEQEEFGVQVTLAHEGWPVGMALDFLRSTDGIEETGLDTTTTELSAGVRKIWAGRRTRPFVGGGLALVQSELTSPPYNRQKDEQVGYWIDGGVLWRIGRHFNVGLELRLSRANVDFFGQDAKVGGNHAALLLGWGSFQNR